MIPFAGPGRNRILAVGLAGGLLCTAALRADGIDDYLRSAMAQRQIPGLGLAVARDGQIVRLSSYGLAHVETGSPVTADSVFAIASLDKQITAAGLVKAAELGKLGLDDPVAKWVEIDLPGATLRQLVSHLAGLPDDTVASLEGRYFTDYSTAQLLAKARSLVPIAPPGRRFLYSDTGLFLAQLATEKAAGEPWWDFVRRDALRSRRHDLADLAGTGAAPAPPGFGLHPRRGREARCATAGSISTTGRSTATSG